MRYQCVEIRFNFWDGNTEYTVQYSYGISMWFIFNNKETSDAIYSKADTKTKFFKINRYKAEEVLLFYLNSM